MTEVQELRRTLRAHVGAEHHLRVVLEAQTDRGFAHPECRPDAETQDFLFFLGELHRFQSERFVVGEGSFDVLGGLELPGTANQARLLVLIQHHVVVFGSAAQELLARRTHSRVLENECGGREFRRPRHVSDVQCDVAELPVAKVHWHGDSSGQRMIVSRPWSASVFRSSLQRLRLIFRPLLFTTSR